MPQPPHYSNRLQEKILQWADLQHLQIGLVQLNQLVCVSLVLCVASSNDIPTFHVFLFIHQIFTSKFLWGRAFTYRGKTQTNGRQNLLMPVTLHFMDAERLESVRIVKLT